MTNNHRRKLWLPIHHCRWVPWSLTERCIILSTRKYHKIKLVIIMCTYQINVGIQVAFSRLPPLLYDYNRNLRVKDNGLDFLTVSVIITPTKSPRTGFLVRKGPYRVALAGCFCSYSRRESSRALTNATLSSSTWYWCLQVCLQENT